MTRPIRVILLAALTMLLAAASAPARLTPSQAASMLDRYGPPGAAWPDFDGLQLAIIGGLQSGDAGWLALLPRLQTGGDASFNESLPVAVSEALKHRPSNVLRILGVNYGMGRICGDAEIEPTRAQLRAYYAQTIPALRAVSAPELRTLRDACLHRLAYREQRDLADTR